MAGTVVTFYSYKGGVGRSFAMVNVAALLGRWGFSVLCIDFDLEAPGLEDFFRPYCPSEMSSMKQGMVELLSHFAKTRQTPLEWRGYVEKIHHPNLTGVDFIKAGLMNEKYMGRVQKLNWTSLYKKGLGEALETMFEELRDEYDFILIDSRTGVTDFSGIVTAQLPDILAFLFTANEQSLNGATDVANRAVAVRNDMAVDRSRLMLLPIPARFESQVEYHVAQEWRERFARELGEFYKAWAHKAVPAEKLVQASTIPYVPFWSFGERIAVVEDKSVDNSGINYSMENIAALIAHRLGQTRLLAESRDEYVSAAQRLKPNQRTSVLISHAHEDSGVAVQIARQLERQGLSVSMDVHDSDLRHDELRVPNGDTNSYVHLVALMSPSSVHSNYFRDILRTFFREAASDESDRLFIPVLLPGVQETDLSLQIRQYRHVRSTNPKNTADTIASWIRPRSLPKPNNTDLMVRVTSDGNVPLAGAHVCALSDNGTTIEIEVANDGTASVQLVPGKAYKILVAHEGYKSKVFEDFEPGVALNIHCQRKRNGGSVIIQSSGCIPHLGGRLNPVKDTLDRTYLYADKIAINGGESQPVAFQIGEYLDMEDSFGRRSSIVITLIEGRTALIEYEKLN
ncbi:Septum formation inhibitor-activating ATPase [Agrobacterium sp. DSM 25558]|uniref:KGGVGR-motif variant AAA ATPase n=1 Tax=Agrobacterium sp. DSM 25558 TaxID=1907665 RepID=UPI0009726298|nr:TIR domain-containing protein [Agrobacterium sp. DSM 25558]SCX26055.1 Septum formation inhibitor-activating ATPase [Agrobacterium sp. DSM 25558]